MTWGGKVSEGSQVAVVFWGGVEYWPVICVSGNFEQWGYSEEDIASGKIRYEQILHPEDLQKVRSFILQRIAEGYNDAVQQYRILDASGNIHWVEEISLFHTEDNDNLSCQAILRDITTEQENLFRRIRLEKLIANIATNFANLPDNRIDEGINKALKLIGEFAGANRSCLFESSEDCRFANKKYEWCAPGMEPFKSFLNKIPMETIPWLYGKLLEDQTVFIPDIDLLPPEAEKEKALIRFFNTSSLIFYPIFSENKLSECILLDYAKEKLLWQEDSIALLQIVGESISGALKRKKAEEKLAFTGFSVERSSTPTFWVNTEGRFIDINDAACTATGYSREELLQMSVHDISSQMISAPPYGSFENAVEHAKKQVALRFEVMFKRKDNSFFPVEINLDHFCFNSEDYLLAFASDITERKRGEETIKEHLHFLETMLDTIPHPVFYKDTEEKYTGCNSIFASSIIGLPREVIVGRTMHELQESIPQHLANIYREHDLALIKQPGTQFYESKVQCADGKLRYYLFSKSTFNDSEGNLAGIIGVMLDITESKETEKKLREYATELEKANEELKSLDRMKDEFIANVNHELRTPLISIIGFSDALNSGLLGEITEDQKKAIDAVLRNAKKLNRLVDSILHMSRLRSSGVHYEMTIFQFSDMLRNIITDLSLQMKQKGITVQEDITVALPQINGDRNALERVFINLLENSIKFTHCGGEIKVNIRKEDRYVHVIVSDTGIGIPRNKLAEVFERFYQVDSSSTRTFGGLGIGLHISKNIIEAHGGEIWANSDGKSGTSFHVLLPVNLKI